MLKFNKIRLTIVCLVVVLAVVTFFATRQRTVDFNTQVKPIFNKKCIVCHGGVRRQADFSLLFRSEALAINKSGKPAIIPGDPEHSEMIRRLTLKDPEERMPYKHEPLSGAEIEILRKWIKEGAPWGDHWAYVAVKEVLPPKPAAHFFGLIPAAKPVWVRNDIDYFIYDGLEKEGLKPSAEADKATLLRRVSLDLVGLPPSAALARQYLSDGGDGAYERLVDTLLASTHFGEKWATMWLDLARYADTKGYEKDPTRPEIWRYRDWLINAFNADKPYDVFLTEQIAGDLLPDHTDQQLIATGFHRNTMTNDEGGTDNEEFRTAAVLDRVNTTWQGLMGTTFACVQCHSHPYDPFKHDEYYKFVAFFNDTRDEDTPDDYPLLREIHGDDSVKLKSLGDWLARNGPADEAAQQIQFVKTWQPSINSIQCDLFVNSALEDTKYLALRDHGSARLVKVDLDKSNQLIYRFNSNVGGSWAIHLDRVDGPVLKQIAVPKTKDWVIKPVDLPAVSGVHDLYFTYSNTVPGNPLASGLQIDWLHFGRKLSGVNVPGFAEAEKNYWELLGKHLPGIPVMMDNPADMHRVAHVFERGNWLVKGKVVEPDVPHSLNPLPAGAPHNRLGLAEWMTDKRNPLVSRTLVNRLWEQLFGTGLVETLEDMGTQGAAPTHKELLDWLAWKLMNDNRWSVKKCLKEMVMSATYRQESKVSPALLEKDPYNKLYARGPRVRLSAEEVHDQALIVSGLLCDSLYGPPVMPWQPAGIWHSPYSSELWATSAGKNQYRRALYTFWKRSSPYPSMITFDGSSREVCMARRIRTNTPLQALVTLNDSVYVEAARYFAFRMIDGAAGEDAVIGKGYELLMYKPIAPRKLEILKRLYDVAYAKFSKDEDATCEMVGTPGVHDNPRTAAYVVVAEALLNLDEVITKL
jgi:Protein of unknown function (DUF1553)/Protein of unknown function (DUF1549)/Planctomycete cytochrome C